MPPEPLQSSLEGILDFSSQPPLGPIQRQAAARLFTRLIDCFDTLPADRNDDYNRVKLVRLTYEYARTDESKGNFLRAFFDSAGIPIVNTFDGEEVDLADAAQRAELHHSIFNFADFLFENVFLPLKASTRKTPQPSPASHSAIRRLQGGDLACFGTLERVSALKGACLVRDRHRCIITRRFDVDEARNRSKVASREGTVARDDDGNPFDNETQVSALEVAHIIPHSLTRLNASSELDTSKATALAILNMFDNGAAHLISGVDIDRPGNAITLTHDMHHGFGAFDIFFDPVEGQVHTYQIKTFLKAFNLYNDLPVTRTLYLTESRTIDPL